MIEKNLKQLSIFNECIYVHASFGAHVHSCELGYVYMCVYICHKDRTQAENTKRVLKTCGSKIDQRETCWNKP